MLKWGSHTIYRTDDLYLRNLFEAFLAQKLTDQLQAQKCSFQHFRGSLAGFLKQKPPFRHCTSHQPRINMCINYPMGHSGWKICIIILMPKYGQTQNKIFMYENCWKLTWSLQATIRATIFLELRS